MKFRAIKLAHTQFSQRVAGIHTPQVASTGRYSTEGAVRYQSLLMNRCQSLSVISQLVSAY